MKITKLINSYLDYTGSVKRYSPQTVNAYRNDLNQFAEFCNSLSKFTAKDLTEKIIKKYLMQLSEIGLETRSISRKLASVRGLMKYAFQNQIINSNPVGYIKNPRSNKKLPEITTTESILKIYDLAVEAEDEPERIKIIFELLYGCALRVSELCDLNFGDLDIKSRTLRVKGKGSKIRIVPVGEKSIEIVEEYLNTSNHNNNNEPLIKTKVI